MPSSSSSSLLLSITAHRLTKETERADVAERKSIQLAQQLRVVTDHSTSLQLQLDKTQKELGLFKIQLNLANQGPPYSHTCSYISYFTLQKSKKQRKQSQE